MGHDIDPLSQALGRIESQLKDNFYVHRDLADRFDKFDTKLETIRSDVDSKFHELDGRLDRLETRAARRGQKGGALTGGGIAGVLYIIAEIVKKVFFA